MPVSEHACDVQWAGMVGPFETGTEFLRERNTAIVLVHFLTIDRLKNVGRTTRDDVANLRRESAFRSCTFVRMYSRDLLKRQTEMFNQYRVDTSC